MAMYSGNEFDSEKGTQGGLLKFIWSKIYTKFTDVASAISTALADYYTKSEVDAKVAQEVTDRNAAIATLEGALQTSIDSKTTSAETATQIQTAIDALVNGAPLALDTLNELAAALAANETGDDATLAALNTLITTVDGKASQASVDAKVDTADIKPVLTTMANKAKQMFEEFLNVAHFIQHFFGTTYTAVAGTDKLFLKVKHGYSGNQEGGWFSGSIKQFYNSELGIVLKFKQGAIGSVANWGAYADATKDEYDVIVASDYTNEGYQLLFNPAIFGTTTGLTNPSKVNAFVEVSARNSYGPIEMLSADASYQNVFTQINAL